jgi:hypothetical protein
VLKAKWALLAIVLSVSGCSIFKPADPLAHLAECVLFKPAASAVIWQPFSAMGQFQGKAFEMLVYPELDADAIRFTAVGLSPMGAKAFVAYITPSTQSTKVELLFRGQSRVGLPLVSDYLLAWASIADINTCLPKDIQLQNTATGRALYRQKQLWLTLETSAEGRQVVFKSRANQASAWTLRKL